MIPKSTHRDRIADNAEVFDFALSDEDIAELDALDRTWQPHDVPAAVGPVAKR